MSLYTLRPISDRSPFIGQHVTSPFRGSSWSDTRTLLGRELDMLRGRNVVLEVDVAERDLRLDGEIRANAKAASPAVRLAFESEQGPLTFATDKFVRPSWGGSSFMQQDWQHNVRAIALGLEALRKVDRYGITRRGEQYAGWKAIGSGTGGVAVGGMTLTDAAQLVERLAIGDDLGSRRDETVAKIAAGMHPEQARIVREAKAMAHPDRHGGERALWDQLEQALRVLERST